MKNHLVLALIISLFLSCSGQGGIKNRSPHEGVQTKEDTASKQLSSEQLKELKTASKVVYRLPSPTEMALLLHETSALYDEAKLNNPKSTNLYYTDLSRALNLGVYFADLSFTSMFDYPQQAMLFMAAAKALSEDLKIDGVFNESLMTRLENNLDNKDSIMEISAFSYLQTDLVLQENDRAMIAKVVLAGAWIEGLYIATRLETESGKNKVIWEKIGEQKEPLNNLIRMVQDCNDPQLNELVEHLEKLKLAFEGLQKKESASGTGMKKSFVVLSDKTTEDINREAQLCRSLIVRAN